MPALLVWAGAGTAYGARLAGPTTAWFWGAVVNALPALALLVATSRLFVVQGKGTPAPWDPPKNLVVAGPYCYVRNPMLAGVVLFLAAEALMLRSWLIAAWTCVFFAMATTFFLISEEPGLVRRFGEAYRTYKANVPRWLHRLSPWRASAQTQSDDSAAGVCRFDILAIIASAHEPSE